MKVNPVLTLLPERLRERQERFSSRYGLNQTEAEALTDTVALADYFEEVVAKSRATPDMVANWIFNELLPVSTGEAHEFSYFPLTATNFARILDWFLEKRISSSIAKRMVLELARTGGEVSDLLG